MTDERRPRAVLTFGTLVLACTSYSLLLSSVSPALLTIQKDVHTSTTTVAWVLTAYLLSASVSVPIVGRLGDTYGKRRMLICSLGALAAGSILAALASTVGLLIAGRAIQGCGGAVYPLAYGIIRDELPRERVASGIALISGVLGIGASAGIVLAGPITDGLSYHWLFWIPLAPILVAALACFLVIPESPPRVRERVDWLGSVLLAGWLLALLLAITEGNRWGWTSGRIALLLVATAALFGLWVCAEVRLPTPLVDMRMMRARAVWTTNATSVLLGFGMYGSFVLVPRLVETSKATGYGFGASVTQAGLFLVPTTIAMLLVSPVVGGMATRSGPKRPLLLGLLATAAALTLLAVAHRERWEIFVDTTLLGIGLGFAFSSLANSILEAVPASQTGVATGMNTIMRFIGSALSAEAAAAVVSASARSHEAPTEHGFALAFGISACVVAAAFVMALAVPGRPRARSPVAVVEAAEAAG